GEIADTLGACPGPAILDVDSISLDPTEFPQAGDKSNRPRIPDRRVCTQHPDVSRGALLRLGDERPRGNSARKKFHEIPGGHGLSPRRGLRRAAGGYHFLNRELYRPSHSKRAVELQVWVKTAKPLPHTFALPQIPATTCRLDQDQRPQRSELKACDPWDWD